MYTLLAEEITDYILTRYDWTTDFFNVFNMRISEIDVLLCASSELFKKQKITAQQYSDIMDDPYYVLDNAEVERAFYEANEALLYC